MSVCCFSYFVNDASRKRKWVALVMLKLWERVMRPVTLKLCEMVVPSEFYLFLAFFFFSVQ